MNHSHLMTSLLLSIPLWLVGCSSVRPYTARDDLVDRNGPAQAAAQLEEVLKRATLPRVLTVEVTPIFLRYQAPGIGPFDIPLPLQWYQIEWRTFLRVDVYANNRSFIFDNINRELAWLQFATSQDAETFADLMHSFAGWVQRNPGAAGAPNSPWRGPGSTPTPLQPSPAPQQPTPAPLQ